MVSVSEQGKSNIPAGAVTIDLNQPVTLKSAELLDDYRMEVKLFGFLPFKQVGIQVIEDQELIPVGVPIGIYVKTDGILVIGVGEFAGQDGVSYSPAKYVLKSGDYIRKLNGEPVTQKDDFIQRIEQCGGSEVVLSVQRDEELMELKVQPVRNQNGAYKIGVWVRDNAQGVGTMTLSLIHISLNNAAKLETNFIIVLNDNNMSISENVGGVSKYLNNIRTATGYLDFKEGLYNALKGTRRGDTMVARLRSCLLYTSRCV